MTLDDFNTKMKSYRLSEIVSGFSLMLGMVFGAFFGSFLESRVNQFGFDRTCIVAALVFLPLMGIFIFYGISRFPKKRLRQLGLMCPTCHKALVGTTRAKRKLNILLTTGRCGFCGSQILKSENGVD